MKISVFHDLLDSRSVNNYEIEDVFSWIKNGKYKKQIDVIRSKQSALVELKKDSEDYKRIDLEKATAKKGLASIVFQGTFTHRAKNGISEHSEIATMDFDHVKDPTFLRDYFIENYKFVYAAFISPSGDGVKVLVKIPKCKDDDEYKQYYIVLLNYFDDATRDTSTKDISRVCFVSYDPDIKVKNWDDVTYFKQKHDVNAKPIETQEPIKIRNQDRAFDVARKMIQNSVQGSDMHFVLLKASRLLGGYVANNSISEVDAVNVLEYEIQQKPIRSFKDAQKTIRDGLKYGKLSPIRNEQQEVKQFIDPTKSAVIDYINHNELKFPIEIYPDQIRKMITELHRCLNYPVDFTASGVLAVFSTIIRNSLRVEPFAGYTDSACIWLMQIGEPGSAKTYPLKTLFDPLENVEANYIGTYKREFEDYEANDKQGKKPKQSELLVRDFTIESLAKSLDYNKAGVGLYIDELKTWIEGMGKYSAGKSNDIQIWLSIFGNSAIKVMRKSQDIPVYIQRPFVAVAGTIQPDELMDINNRYSANGFFDRFLFVYPAIGMEKRTRNELDINIIKQYNENIYSIFKEYEIINSNVITSDQLNVLRFTPEAQDEYYRVDDWLVDVSNNELTNSALKSYISKLRTYLPRLCLVMEAITSAFNGYIPVEIERANVLASEKLIRYFYSNSELIYSKFNQTKDISEYIDSNKGKSKQDKIYQLHIDGVPTKEIAKKFKIAEGTVRSTIHRMKK